MSLLLVSSGRCQFCHQTAEDVAQILAGDSGFICNECVEKCAEGASPAFIKELLRRVAQHYLEAGSPPQVSRAVTESALHEMLFSGGVLNKRLLGGEAIDATTD